jgi:hypothetical protein
MTVATTGGPASPWGDLGDVGLEDVGASDVQMPRLIIDHKAAMFKDSSTGQMFDSLEVVMLGVVKQRIMWDSQIDDNDKPQCKSPAYDIGFPQMRTDIPARKQFPWAKAVFDQADFPPDDKGQIRLPCDKCNLKDWGADKEKPPCSEQYTFGVYYKDEDGNLRPAIISFQRSGLKAARSYAGTFKAASQPMFTVWTKLTLTAESRGKTEYATPGFIRGGASESAKWAEYAEAYRSVRAFLHQDPRPATKEADEAAAAARSSRPAPASATAATKLADDDPWATSPASPSGSSTPPPDDDLPF